MSKKAPRTGSHGPAAKAPARIQPAPKPRPGWLPYAGAAGLAAMVFLWAYSPVLRTGFIFDDTKQIFALPAFSGASLSVWIGPVRPVLMFTYWLNVQISKESTVSYHVFNLAIHAL